MSVILQGDGNLTSSIAFPTITLPDPAPTPDIMEDNVDIVEGDGGWTVAYEKGTYRRIFPYRFTLLSASQKDDIWKWWQLIKGRLHWFTLQPHGQAVTQIFAQEGPDSTYKIKNSLLVPQPTHYWRGFWALILSGTEQGAKRKIINSRGDDNPNWGDVDVSPPFDNAIVTGTDVLLGYPVALDEARINFSPRIPDFWDVETVFREKMMS